MYKKIILILSIFLLVGCGTNISKMSIKEIIDDAIINEQKYLNVNNKGYRYYLPDTRSTPTVQHEL